MSRFARLAALVAGTVFVFYLGISWHVYSETIPRGADPTVAIVLRKAYSLAAFAVVGFAIRSACGVIGYSARALTLALAVAAFSGVIEVVQRVHGSPETFAWNVGDIAFGAAGGLIAAMPLPHLNVRSELGKARPASSGRVRQPRRRTVSRTDR